MGINNIKTEIQELNKLVENILVVEKLNKIEKNVLLNKLAQIYEKVSLIKTNENLISKQEEDDSPEVEVELVFDKSHDFYPEPEQQEIQESNTKLEENTQQVNINTNETESEKLEIEIPIEVTPKPTKEQEQEQETPLEATGNKAEEIEDAKEDILPERNEEKPEPILKEAIEPEINIKDIPNQSIADIEPSQTSLHDIIAKNSSDDLATSLQKSKLNDIKDAISLVDSFLYIKELFSNSKEKYNQTIDILNNANNLKEAIDYLNNNFNWDTKDETVIKFIDLVNRRFV